MRLIILLAAALALLPPGLEARQDDFDTGEFARIAAFGPAAERGGWALIGARLWRTADAGATWRDITPAGAGLALADVDFAGAAGWAVALAGADWRLARTADGGATWQWAPLAPYAAGEPVAPADALYLDFVDETRGWLAVRHVTSAQFSHGDLFETTDGGVTWERRTLPIGERPRFAADGAGVVTGGVTGTEAHRTTDGGRTWQPQAFAAGDADTRWAASHAAVGWRVAQAGDCSTIAAARRCTATQTLLSTTDGGASWSAIPLPAGAARAAFTLPAPPAPGAAFRADGITFTHTEIVQGHGFDKCEIATIPQLTDWFANSPYRTVNIYFGGGSRACLNSALSPALLRQLQAIGWRFIPTWVGKQAPCFAHTSKEKMSWDPEAAFIQGIEEANWAADRLFELGLTDAEGAGSVAYFDLEYYPTGDAACHTAVKSFVTGWSAQMRARGNVAGVYSTGGIVSTLASIQAPPDVIWPANWLTPYQFRPDASVWNVGGLSNTVWADHQRVRQYSGGHNETWGATTLNIDCDVLDGVVARVGPAPTPTITPTRTVTPTPSMTPTPWQVTDRVWLPRIIR